MLICSPRVATPLAVTDRPHSAPCRDCESEMRFRLLLAVAVAGPIFLVGSMVVPGSADAASHRRPPPTTTTTTTRTKRTTTTTRPTTTTTRATTTTTATTQPARTTTTIGPRVIASGCRFDSAPAGDQAALCETFDNQGSSEARSPALSSLWGVSRYMGNINSGQGQYDTALPTVLNRCGTNVSELPPADVQVCNGQLVEAVTDNGTVTSLAMYPKQPFDIAGRTGTMSFDVSDDSGGNHSVWPEIWYTSSPAPVPFTHESSLVSVPQNAVAVRFANSCTAADQFGCFGRYPSVPTGPWVTVDSAAVVTNYADCDTFAGPTPCNVNVQVLDAVRASTGPGNNNHFEIRYSTNQIDVYGTDAGTVAPWRHLAVITGFTMPLTRGLLWMEDGHYNGNKGVDPVQQGTHTFSWDNFGFDGPVLPRDKTFDAPDSESTVPGLGQNIGYPVPNDGVTPVSMDVPGVSLANATSAKLLFNDSVNDQTDLSYRVNSGAWQTVPACRHSRLPVRDVRRARPAHRSDGGNEHRSVPRPRDHPRRKC